MSNFFFDCLNKHIDFFKFLIDGFNKNDLSLKMSPLLLILETYCFKITKLELSLTKKIEHPSTVLR